MGAVIQLFNDDQLEALRAAYGKFEQMPVTKLPELDRILEVCSTPALRQLSQANVRFISKLAANRVRERTARRILKLPGGEKA